MRRSPATEVGARTWPASNRALSGPDEQPFDPRVSSSPFGNTSVEASGYLEFVGCAALSGTSQIGAANIRIDAPSKITLTAIFLQS